jgi:hypothetical protein
MHKKKINKPLLLIATLLTALVNAAEPNNSNLIIYQKENSGQALRVFINDRYYGILQPQSYAVIPVCPAKNTIAISAATPSAAMVNITIEGPHQQGSLFFEAFQLNEELHLIAIENTDYARTVINNLRAFSGLSRVQKPQCRE